MDKIDNVIINGTSADILLYGEIVNNAYTEEMTDSKSIVSQIIALGQTCDKIRVHINSEGGEVYAGISIFNAIRNCPKEIEIYTDGISASIAGVIAMCGRPHYMSKYARLMIHSVSAGVFGDKNDLQDAIEEMKALEDTLSHIISEKTGITPEEVKEKYFDGKDHWFTADEAVKVGLAEGIYDIKTSLEENDSPKDIYNKVFTNRAELRSQIVNNMELERFKQKPRFTNVTSEEEILQTIDELNTQIETLESENATLKERVENLQKEEIEKILSAAIQAGKIEEGEKENYRSLLNSNRAATEKIINSMKPSRKVKDDLEAGIVNKKSSWDLRMEEIRHNHKK